MKDRSAGAVAGIVAACAIWLTTTTPAVAQPGDLDQSFSGDGKAITDFTDRDDFIWDLAIQADGKIVAAGGSASGKHFALARYRTNGALDTTFGGDGRVVTRMTEGTDFVTAVAIQDDQKIVAAGRVSGSGGRYGLARYLANGKLDITFSGDGKVMTNLTPGRDNAWGVAIQPDGKIVAVGIASPLHGEFSVIRYNTDGSLDTTFSDDGKVITSVDDVTDWAWDVALQEDGKIVVSGVSQVIASNTQLALVRYNDDGTLDEGFGPGGVGWVTANFTAGWDDASGVAIQSDGRIVTAGAGGGSGGRLLMARFNDDGTTDATFSGDGRTFTDFSSTDDYAWELALQLDGKIVAAGSSGSTATQSTIAVARYDSAGLLDPTFSGDGKVTTDATAGFDIATCVAVQTDGAIVVGGSVGGAGGRFAVLRYLAA